ncbi:MAG: response regulator transcription factor [Spirochaetales bacterium]|nr:response regulator transcription factor [Spirochaetales bacterium]
MAGETIFIVEDEPDILNLISYNLRKAGYRTRGVTTGEEALPSLFKERPDLVILDLMLPGIGGFEICREMKGNEKLKNVPVIMLTARTEDVDIVTGLEAGADDYITKPFSPKVVVARVRTVLRRAHHEKPRSENDRISIHGIEIDRGRHEVFCDGEAVELSATEFLILSFLASNPGWVFSRSQIITAVKGEDYPVTERSVDVQILGIRRKLGDYGKNIVTVRGVGYKMMVEST